MSTTLLDEHLPRWDFRELHSRRVEAPPERALAAALALRFRELPLTGALMTLRAAPAALAARRWPARRLDRPWLELLRDFGFVELGRNERELAVGAIGRFWRLREELEPLADADAFGAFDRGGFARGAMNVRAVEAGEGSVLSTETRVWTPDPAARRRFAPYWLLVRAAGEPIRREILRAAARGAARGDQSSLRR